MENLAKHKKINDKILEVLLKNIALQGNFIIQCKYQNTKFAPKIMKILIFGESFLSKLMSN